MVDIQSVAAEIRQGKKDRKKIDRKKLQGKNIMAPLLHRAAIIMTNNSHASVYGALFVIIAVVRIHPIQLMNADSAPGCQADRLGL